MRSTSREKRGRMIGVGLVLTLFFLSLAPSLALAADFWTQEEGWDALVAAYPPSGGWSYGYIRIPRSGLVDYDCHSFAYKGTLTSVEVVDQGIYNYAVTFYGVTEAVKVQIGTGGAYSVTWYSGDYAWGSSLDSEYGAVSWGTDMGFTPYTLPMAISPVWPVDEADVTEPGDLTIGVTSALYYSVAVNGVSIAIDAAVPVGGVITVPWTSFGWKWRNAVWVEVYTEVDRSDAIDLDYQFDYVASVLTGRIDFPQSGFVDKGSRTFSGYLYNYSPGLEAGIVNPDNEYFLFTPVYVDAERYSFSIPVPVEKSGTYRLSVNGEVLNSIYLSVHVGGVVVPDPDGTGGDFEIGSWREMLSSARDLVVTLFSFLPQQFLGLIPVGLGIVFLARVLGR